MTELGQVQETIEILERLKDVLTEMVDNTSDVHFIRKSRCKRSLSRLQNALNDLRWVERCSSR